MMKTGRRGFLKSAALAAGGAAQAGAQQQGADAEPVKAAASSSIQYPRTFTGRHLEMLSFPLGGVAAGSVCLGGRGQLRDWEIFNRADKGRTVNYAFPSIWAQSGNDKPVARVLEARLMAPYQSASGLSPSQVSGLTRLEQATFVGEYPLARITFRDRDLPVDVALEAFTPIIPLDADESGLPVAILRYRVKNPRRQSAKVAIGFSLENPVGVESRGGMGSRPLTMKRTNEYRDSQGLNGLFMTNPEIARDSPLAGSMALAFANGGGKLSHLTGWPRAKWWASPLLFWDDFSNDGELGPENGERNAVGSICQQREIAPGASADYTILLAWHFPNRTPAWCGWISPTEADRNTIIGNYYSHRFRDAWDAAQYAASNLEALEGGMRKFLIAMRETTLPAAVKEAAMANLSTLATPTSFRTSDGKFRGFEGINDDRGCCHGNCTHVWNYETTTQHVFPSLARSMREQAFDLSERLNGILPIRLALPEGKQTGGTTAADGTMGQIIKTYIDWQLSGDQVWLAELWPRVKKALEFAWVDGGWDGDRDGVMEGVQHNTYDVEFYGPNPMCGVYYLGALRAAEEMAKATGDNQFAGECRRLFTSGSKWIDQNLFNGEHYVQKIRGIPVDKIAQPLRSRGGAEDPEHPDFQLGEGCLTDQLIGQYLADVAGLGPLLDPAHIQKTIATIYKYNHRNTLIHHNSVERIYALNDEAAVLICDYAPGKRPRIPFPYSSESWTGIEYLFATQLIYAGMIREGVQCYDDVRRRFDGERRDPWDEPECGHHYARAMSAWSGLVALSGFRYNGVAKSVIAAPRVRQASISCFWSTGTGWGTFSRAPQDAGTRFTLAVTRGKLPCSSVEFEAAAGAKSSASLGAKSIAHEVRVRNRRATFTFSEALELTAGDRLVLSL
jgi:uncharacterized protein (DUF608 family)